MNSTDATEPEVSKPTALNLLIERWIRERPARSARSALLRLLPGISPGLTLGLLLIIGGIAAGTVAFTIAAGELLGGLPAAARSGFDSAAGRRVVGALVISLCAFVVQQSLGPLQAMLSDALSRKVDGKLRERVMRATLSPASMGHLEDPGLRDKVRDAQGLGTGQFTPGLAVKGMVENAGIRVDVLASAVLLGVVFEWWLAVVLVVFGLVVRYKLVDDLLRTASRGTGQTQVLRRADYIRDLVLTPEAAKELRIFGLGGWLLTSFKNYWLHGMQTLWRDRKANTPVILWSPFWGVFTFGSLYLVGRAGLDGQLSLRDLVIAAQSVIGAGSIWISQGDIFVAYGANAVPAVLALENKVAAGTSGADAAARLPQRDIRFEDVTFTYPGRDDPVYDRLSLVIPAGRSIAIVGPNGAGKTTLVKLLARFHDPSSGRITVDGVDLSQIDALSWQRRLAAIFQDFIRFELSAHRNVAFGAPEREGDRDAVINAARSAGANDFIERLPNGWDTTLSREYQQGAELSGGQWQRVALARALFALEAGASVLVLDEPTANLDVRAEAELFDRFIELTRGTTTILISHRFSTVRRADLIYVLDEGRIQERGSHQELMAIGGKYARMFNLQAQRFTETAVASDPGGEP